jgi:hypothetical protein
MSLALIQESAKEVRRLSIAGSPLAVGDFRLKKLIPPLEQADAKVPVFAQVAKSIGDLVNGKEADSAANLLSLSTLLNAILYTQGQSGAEGDYRELETFTAKSASTKTSARVLKPLIEALTSTGGGRHETVKAAVERGAFADLRLIEPSLRALDDTYPELADLVAEKVLPSYGPGIVPLLKQKLELKGKKSDARRLAVMHKLDPAGTIELCKTALEEGSAEVKVAAIACLGRHEECLLLILEQTNAKNKMLRAAALEALAEHDRPETTKLFTDLIKGKSLEVLVSPMRTISSKQVLGALLGEGQRAFDQLLKGDAEQLSRYWELLACLGDRKESEVEDFLLACMGQSDKLAKIKTTKKSVISGDDLLERLSSLLHNFGSPKALEAVLARRDILPVASFSQVFQSALRTWPPEKVYQEFSPFVGQKKGAAKEKGGVVDRLIWTICRRKNEHLDDLYDEYLDPDEQTLEKVTLDPRWLEAAIKADQPLIVCALAKSGDKEAVIYLLSLLEPKTRTLGSAIIPAMGHTGLIIETLARCQYPKLTDAFLGLVTRKTKKAQHVDYDLQMLFRSVRRLPTADLPKLDAFAASLDEKFVDKYLEALEPLRLASQGKAAGPT